MILSVALWVSLLIPAAPVAAQDAVDDRLASARAAVGRQNFEQAENTFRALIADHPGLADAYAGLADALLGQSRADEAFATLMTVGQGLVESGEVDSGTNFLERAVRLKPNSSAGNAALGGALLRANRHRQARTHLEAAIELGETEPIVRLFLAAAQWESGAYDEAQQTYREILLVPGPTADAARRSLGALLLFRGEYASAVPMLAAAVGGAAESAQVRYDLACALEGAGRTAEATELLALIVADHPRFIQAHFRLARLLQVSGHPDRANRHMQIFQQLHLEQQRETRELGLVEAQLKQGWHWLREGRHDQARGLFSSLPETPDALSGLAEASRRGGDLDAAVSALRRALELDPERFDLRLTLDEILIEAGSR